MPSAVDYRRFAFDASKISACGKYVGTAAYWRLYAVENMFRVLIHSVLSVQLDPNWLPLVITGDKRRDIERMKFRYLSTPGATLPGRHDIYYLYLRDLTKILADHSTDFLQNIPDIDEWIVKLEQLHLPRNIVGHMNWPRARDRTRIDRVYRQSKKLMRRFQTSGIAVLIP